MSTYKLDDVCEFITDGTHQTPTYCEDGGVIFLSSKDVTSRKIDWENAKHIPDELHAKLYKRLAPQRNDILLAKNGTTGVAAIVDRDDIFDVYVSLAVLRPKKEIYPHYLLYAINSPVAKRQFNAGLKGIGVPNLHLSVIRNTRINVCNYERQVEICDILEKISNVIEARKQELEKLDKLIKARFVEMFNLNDCFYGTFGEDTDFVDYRGKTPKLSEVGTVRMVNAKSVGKGVFKDVNEYVTEEVYSDWMHRGFGYPGDVLFVTEGHTFGNTCLVPEYLKKFALGQRVITIKGHKDIVDNVFLCTYMQLNQFIQDINIYRTGGTAQGIRSKDLEKVRIPLPEYEMQREFATFASQVNKSKAAIQKALDKTQLLFDSLMQKYFG